MTAADVLAGLDGVGDVGRGQWIAQCLSHEDRSPSIRIRDTVDRTLPAAERMELVEHEITTVALILAAAAEADWNRLAQALSRIGRARHV